MLVRLKDRLRRHIARLPRRGTTPSWRHSCQLLERHGFRPNVVFDIGVAYGTFELYQAFPKAFYHLIDPTPESLHHMHLLQQQLNCQIHQVALGDRDGEVDIEIRPDIQAATMLEDTTEREVLRHDRVPMHRLDRLIDDFDRPSLCKIDVQGAELMVLEGMTGCLGSMDAVIVETSTIASLKGGPEVHDIVHFMHRHDFVVADILGMVRRPLDDATAQLDLLFLPRNSPMRADRRWC